MTEPNKFSDDWKWVSFQANTDVPALIAQYGAAAQDRDEVYVTLLCGWDDEAQTRKRALSLGGTASIAQLTNGQLGTGGMFTLAVIAAWEAGDIVATELTESEYKALLPTAEEL